MHAEVFSIKKEQLIANQIYKFVNDYLSKKIKPEKTEFFNTYFKGHANAYTRPYSNGALDLIILEGIGVGIYTGSPDFANKKIVIGDKGININNKTTEIFVFALPSKFRYETAFQIAKGTIKLLGAQFCDIECARDEGGKPLKDQAVFIHIVRVKDLTSI